MAWALAWLGRVASYREQCNLSVGQKTKFWTWEIGFSLLIFTFFIGVRFNYGIDYLSYLDGYENFKHGNIGLFDNVEGGFTFIVNILAYFDVHFSIFFALVAFIQIFIIYYALKEERYLLPFVVLLIILGPHLVSMCGGLRQWVAAFIFLFSIRYIANKNLIKYLICIFIAYTMHKSVLILIPLYFLPVNKKIIPNVYIQIGLLLLCVFLGLNPSWTEILFKLEDLLFFLNYSNYSETLSIWMEEGNDFNFGFQNISLLTVSIITIILFNKIQKQYKDNKLIILFNLFLIGVCYYFVMFRAGIIFFRINIYFSPVVIVLNAYLLLYIKNKMTFKNIYLPLFIIVIVLTMSISFKNVIQSGQVDMGERRLYSFFWDYTEKERRSLINNR